MSFVPDHYPPRIAVGICGITLLVTASDVVSISKGDPQAMLIVINVVLLLCSVLAVVGWRKERHGMLLAAGLGVVAVAFAGSWLFAS
ncbi:hypothetical protein OG775_37830 [Streptomyces platensis]|uniref:hypothetical protein n=1 Tax=Streptomyces platensis TaxID=58346 RepID=UPI0022537F4E|nr:hypothetical protein [Streptomyces platensis]MCX4640795.1 hypothetical protein [Streptomyces platensis]